MMAQCQLLAVKKPHQYQDSTNAVLVRWVYQDDPPKRKAFFGGAVVDTRTAKCPTRT
jgi:hypothetical protein